MHGRVAVIALLFAGGLIVAALAPAAPAQSQTPAGTWTQKTPMPAVRGEVAAAAVGDRLFAVGGSVAGKAVARPDVGIADPPLEKFIGSLLCVHDQLLTLARFRARPPDE